MQAKIKKWLAILFVIGSYFMIFSGTDVGVLVGALIALPISAFFAGYFFNKASKKGRKRNE